MNNVRFRAVHSSTLCVYRPHNTGREAIIQIAYFTSLEFQCISPPESTETHTHTLIVAVYLVRMGVKAEGNRISATLNVFSLLRSRCHFTHRNLIEDLDYTALKKVWRKQRKNKKQKHENIKPTPIRMRTLFVKPINSHNASKWLLCASAGGSCWRITCIGT